MPAVAVAEHLPQSFGLAQSGVCSVHVTDGDRATEDGSGVVVDRVVAEGDQVVVPRQDLRPVRLVGGRGVVVQRSDGGFDLVPIWTLQRQRGLQDAHALGDLAGVPKPAVLPVEGDDAALRVELRREDVRG